MRNIFKKIFVFFVFINLVNIKLNAKIDNLQEWSQACFKNCKEYCTDFTTVINKSVLSDNDEEAFKEFNGVLVQATSSIRSRNKKKVHPYVEKIKVKPGAKICVMGDIHGAVHSLLRNLLRLKVLGYINDDFIIPDDKDFYIIFTGDYGDRGAYSSEVLYTLARLKLRNMNKVFLLRGNHEEELEYKLYGLLDELKRKFTSNEEIDNLVKNFYNSLPIAFFIGCKNNWIECCHGGIEWEYDEKSLIKKIKNFLKSNKHILQMSNDSWLGFIRGDFLERALTEGDQRSSRPPSDLKRTNDFLKKYGLKFICRGHQHSGFGLKIGGEIHWKNKPGLLEKASERDGFLIKDLDYPVATFSTASADIIKLAYDCFGIITVRKKWDDWRLLPYEFKLDNSSRNGKYVKIIEFNQNPGNLVDPIKFEFLNEAAEDPIPSEVLNSEESELVSIVDLRS